MDLIGLNELAKLRKIHRRRLLRQLRAVERELKMKLIYQGSRKSKIWVPREVLNLLRDRAHQDLKKRVTRTEAQLRSHEVRIEELETKL